MAAPRDITSLKQLVLGRKDVQDLTDEETEAMSRCSIAHRLLHFWCAKEAEWKRHGGGTVTASSMHEAAVTAGGTAAHDGVWRSPPNVAPRVA